MYVCMYVCVAIIYIYIYMYVCMYVCVAIIYIYLVNKNNLYKYVL